MSENEQSELGAQRDIMARDQDPTRFAQLYAQNERYLRSYIFNMLPFRDAVDEVLQQACVVLWEKFGDLRRDEDFLRWAYVVTRYEVLAYRRDLARSKLVFDSELMTQLSEDYEEEAEDMKERHNAFNVCFALLPKADQDVFTNVYRDGKKIRDVAVTFGKTPTSFYRYMRKLRSRIRKCVEMRLNEKK